MPSTVAFAPSHSPASKNGLSTRAGRGRPSTVLNASEVDTRLGPPVAHQGQLAVRAGTRAVDAAGAWSGPRRGHPVGQADRRRGRIGVELARDLAGREPEVLTAQVELARRGRHVDPLERERSRALHQGAQLGQGDAGTVRAEPRVLQVERQLPVGPLEPDLVGAGDLGEPGRPAAPPGAGRSRDRPLPRGGGSARLARSPGARAGAPARSRRRGHAPGG